MENSDGVSCQIHSESFYNIIDVCALNFVGEVVESTFLMHSKEFWVVGDEICGERKEFVVGVAWEKVRRLG